jgi:hypothetical protein
MFPMGLRRLFALVTLLGFTLGPLAAFAKQSAACELAEKIALKKVLKKVGASLAEDLGSTAAVGGAVASSTVLGMDVIIEYFTHPDETNLDAAWHKLLEGGTKIVFPTYGITVMVGRVVLGTSDKPGLASIGAEHVVQAAKSGQLDAFICGDRSFGNLFGQASFFDLAAVRSRGITCDNFTSRIQTEKDLEDMKSLWFGYYKRQLLDLNPGVNNSYGVNTMLNDGWGRLEEQWKTIWAEKLARQLRDALRDEAAQFKSDQASAVCYPPPTPAPTPIPKPTQPPLVRSAHGCVGFEGTWQTPYGALHLANGSGKVAQKSYSGKVNGANGGWTLGGVFTNGKDEGPFSFLLSRDGDSFTASERSMELAKWFEFSGKCISGPPATPPPPPTPKPAPTASHCPGNWIYYPGLGCRPNPD